jgi:hypothetical protein
VLLLTNPAALRYFQNPISVYYCYSPGGSQKSQSSQASQQQQQQKKKGGGKAGAAAAAAPEAQEMGKGGPAGQGGGGWRLERCIAEVRAGFADVWALPMKPWIHCRGGVWATWLCYRMCFATVEDLDV